MSIYSLHLLNFLELLKVTEHCLSSKVFISAAATKSLQLCPTLCDPIDGSPPGSPVPGIFQARTLEWVAISFSNAWKWKVKVKSLSRVRLFMTPWTAAHQVPPPMGFSRQEYWSGMPLPSPRTCYETPVDIHAEPSCGTRHLWGCATHSWFGGNWEF